MKKILIAVLFIFLKGLGQDENSFKFSKTITELELSNLLYEYSSDYFEGRGTGQKGQKKAVEFLKNYYIKEGISPGKNSKNYFQPFSASIVRQNGSYKRLKLDEDGEIKSENVISIIKGSIYPEQYIVLSAHLDGSGFNMGKIYNSADDNGSGTVALLEIAQAFKLAEKNGHGPKRSIVFLHFSAEENGLIGSEFYVKNPLYDLKNTVVNLNLDMIGRIDPKRVDKNQNYIYLIGSNRLSNDLHNISEKVNSKTEKLILDYTYNSPNDPNRFYERSDHWNFAKNNIPVIFYFSGTHEDYHKPTDTADKIEYKLLKKRTKLIFHTIWEIANRDQTISLN